MFWNTLNSDFLSPTMDQEFRSGGKLDDFCFRLSTHTSLSHPSVNSSLALSFTEDSLQTEVAKGLLAVSFCCLGFVVIPRTSEIFS